MKTGIGLLALAGAMAAAMTGAPAAGAQSRAVLEDDIDIFAAAVLDAAQRDSFRDNAEYCGLIGYTADGRLAATPARRGDQDGCTPAPEPDGFRVIASYHTHGAYAPDADTETPSVDDLEGDFAEDIDGYVATPSGRLWVNSLDDRTSYLLCGPGCLTADARFEPCPRWLPLNSYTIGELRARDAADDGAC